MSFFYFLASIQSNMFIVLLLQNLIINQEFLTSFARLAAYIELPKKRMSTISSRLDSIVLASNPNSSPIASANFFVLPV